jgi:hypothetical protein
MNPVHVFQYMFSRIHFSIIFYLQNGLLDRYFPIQIFYTFITFSSTFCTSTHFVLLSPSYQYEDMRPSRKAYHSTIVYFSLLSLTIKYIQTEGLDFSLNIKNYSPAKESYCFCVILMFTIVFTKSCNFTSY